MQSSPLQRWQILFDVNPVLRWCAWVDGFLKTHAMNSVNEGTWDTFFREPKEPYARKV